MAVGIWINSSYVFSVFEDSAYPVYFGKLRMFWGPVSFNKVYV